MGEKYHFHLYLLDNIRFFQRGNLDGKHMVNINLGYIPTEPFAIVEPSDKVYESQYIYPELYRICRPTDIEALNLQNTETHITCAISERSLKEPGFQIEPQGRFFGNLANERMKWVPPKSCHTKKKP